MTYELTLDLHDLPDAEESRRMRDAARLVPRCSSCRHHPNAHTKSGCTVVVERPGNRAAKCPCGGDK